MMAVIGTDANDVDRVIKTEVPTKRPGSSSRRALAFAAFERRVRGADRPARDVYDRGGGGPDEHAVVQSSPTNKTLPGVVHLAQRVLVRRDEGAR